MFLSILSTVAPVFLLLLCGNLAVRTRYLKPEIIDGLMKFSTHVAIPCLLFRATSTIELGTAYDWRVLFAYFSSVTLCFVLAMLVAYRHFNRRPGEAVAVAFSSLFANMVLLGLPVITRAYGEQGEAVAITIISINAPFCYLIGIATMEAVRADGRTYSDTLSVIVRTMFKNTLMIGIALGFIVNISGVALPEPLTTTIDMLKSAALPCALFSLGGLLVRYSVAEQITESGLLTAISLLVCPIVAYALSTLVGLDGIQRNIVVVLASIPPGLNAYLFASMYARGIGTASSNVLIGTVTSVFTITIWLWLLP